MVLFSKLKHKLSKFMKNFAFCTKRAEKLTTFWLCLKK